MLSRQSETVAGVRQVGRFGRVSSRTRRSRRRRSAFTLLEAALATVIIGVGVLALIQAQTVFVGTNEWSSQNATGTYLCNELRERLRRLPRHDPITGLYFDSAASGGSGGTLRGWGPEAGETSPSDYNDVDDFDGVSFGAGAQFAGPIDAECRLIPRVGLDGLPVTDSEGQGLPLAGWSQTISVSKVDPFNFGITRAPEYERPAAGTVPALAVDRFPLRVIVTSWYQGPNDPVRREMARVSWIQP